MSARLQRFSDRLLIFLALVLALAPACGRSRFAGTLAPRATDGLVFDRGKVVVHGLSLHRGIKLAQLEAQLGKSQRIVRGVLHVHLYEEQGLALYVRPTASAEPDAEVVAIRAYLAPWPHWLRPANVYTQAVVVQGKAVTAATTKEEVAGQLGAHALQDVAGSEFRASSPSALPYAKVVAQLTRAGTGYVEIGLVDPKSIVHPADRACDDGDVQACTAVAYAYHAGTTLADGMPRALTSAAKACSGNQASACLLLAGMTARGEGKLADREQALTLYLLLCEKGIRAACAALPPPSTPPVQVPDEPVGSLQPEPLSSPLATQAEQPTCEQEHPTKLWNESLRCAKRGRMREAIVQQSGVVQREDLRYFADLYLANHMLDHAVKLMVGYTESDKLALVDYTFATDVAARHVEDLLALIDRKYGPARSSDGYVAWGPLLWQWQLNDDIVVHVERENTATPIHLVYVLPDHYALMRREMAQSRELQRDQDARRQFHRL